MESYVAALVAPFSRDAIGAQVPDMYSFPTETQMVRCEFKIGTDENGSCDFIIQPSLFQTILCGCPYVNSSLARSSPNVSAAAIGGVFVSDFNPLAVVTPIAPPVPVSGSITPATTGTWNSCGVLTPGVLNTQMQRYRIVGMGCRIRCLTAPLNQQGRVILATLPSARLSFPAGIAGNTATASNASYAQVCQWLDLPFPDASGYQSTEILNIPESMECMLSDLSLRGGIEWVAKPTATGSIAFRDTFNDVVLSSSLNLVEAAIKAA